MNLLKKISLHIGSLYYVLRKLEGRNDSLFTLKTIIIVMIIIIFFSIYPHYSADVQCKVMNPKHNTLLHELFYQP